VVVERPFIVDTPSVKEDGCDGAYWFNHNELKYSLLDAAVENSKVKEVKNLTCLSEEG